MKKSLIALAVMAAAGAASAQSSVTLFGIIDTTLQWSESDQGAGDVRFRVTNSGYNSSRLGFRGVEDLGGGLSASFWLEGQLSTDDGTPGGLQFLRRSTVSLSGNSWGEVRLGRDYAPTFWNLAVFDPFGFNGSGTTLTAASNVAPSGVRANNSIGYFLPRNLGGFYGQVMYAENELPNNAALVDSGTYWGIRGGYAAGPFNVAISYGQLQDVSVAAGDVDGWNIGGQWDFGMGKLMGQYARAESNLGETDSWLIGGLVPVGAGEIRISYSQAETDNVGTLLDPELKKLAVGYVHNLSKRTAVYVTYARLEADNGGQAQLGGSALSNVNGDAQAVDLGIRHAF